MQVSLTELDRPLGRKLLVSLKPERFSSAVSARLRELSRSVQLKGFRPGKVPAMVIEQRFGSQVRAEVTEELVRESLGQALSEQGLRPVTTPSVRFVAEPTLARFDFEAEFDVLPEIAPIDPGKLRIERLNAEITDDDVAQMIESLRSQRRRPNVVARAAAVGDLVGFQVVLSGEGRRHPADGVDHSACTLGSGAVLPEIEAALVGLAAGDEKVVEVVMPQRHPVTELAGRQAQAWLKVIEVHEMLLPEVDAEFVRSFGVASGEVQDLHVEVRRNLERELKARLSGRLRQAVGEAVHALHADLPVPQALLDQEVAALRRRLEERAKERGATPSYPDDLEATARKRLVVGILLGEVARQNGIRVDSGRVGQAIAAIASTYEDPEEVVEMYRKDQKLMQQVAEQVLEEQVAEWIAERAQTSVRAISFSELLAA